MTKSVTFVMGAGANDNGDEGAVMITDADLDALVDAELAWERWERTRRWWMQGSIDDATSAA
jgi:hypothetical protein